MTSTGILLWEVLSSGHSSRCLLVTTLSLPRRNFADHLLQDLGKYVRSTALKPPVNSLSEVGIHVVIIPGLFGFEICDTCSGLPRGVDVVGSRENHCASAHYEHQVDLSVVQPAVYPAHVALVEAHQTRLFSDGVVIDTLDTSKGSLSE